MIFWEPLPSPSVITWYVNDPEFHEQYRINFESVINQDEKLAAPVSKAFVT